MPTTSPYPRREFGEPAPLEPRPMSESKSLISQVMLPNDANPMGNVHGGAVMRLVDVGAAVAAMRHSRRQVVTVALDHMSFLEPVYIGDLITITSQVEYVGKTSMLVRAVVEAENPTSGRKVVTSNCVLTFVALGDDGRPSFERLQSRMHLASDSAVKRHVRDTSPAKRPSVAASRTQ